MAQRRHSSNGRSTNSKIPTYEREIAPERERAEREGGRLLPGDAFNARGDVRALLEAQGWTSVEPGAFGELWRRPGKDFGHSATLFSDRNFWPFTTNAYPLEADVLYSPFALYAYLEHDGDFSKAVGALAKAGYGDPLDKTKVKTNSKPTSEAAQDDGADAGTTGQSEHASNEIPALFLLDGKLRLEFGRAARGNVSIDGFFDREQPESAPLSTARRLGLQPAAGMTFDLSGGASRTPPKPAPQPPKGKRKLWSVGPRVQPPPPESSPFAPTTTQQIGSGLDRRARARAALVGPETNERLRKIEEFEAQPITTQIGQQAKTYLASGGAELSRLARRAVGAGLGAAQALQGGKFENVDPRPEALRKWEEERQRELVEEKQRYRPTLANEVAEGVIEGAPVAAAAGLAGAATGGGALATMGTGGAIGALGADWNEEPPVTVYRPGETPTTPGRGRRLASFTDEGGQDVFVEYGGGVSRRAAIAQAKDRLTSETSRSADAPLPAPPKIASAPAQTPKHDYSTTQVNLPKPVADKIGALGRRIPDADLAEDGREAQPHITVKYGLHGDDPEAIRQALAGEEPIRVKLGRASVLESDDFDVVKVGVRSPDLRRLNKKLADALPHTDTHPKFGKGL